MTLQEQLQADLKEAMKARDSLRLDVLRGARAALQSAHQEADKQRYDAAVREIEQRHAGDSAARDAALAAMHIEPTVLDEEAQQAVIAREAKRRRDAAETYQQAGQTERYEQEIAEAQILEHYLPRQLSADELRPEVAAIAAELGLSGPASMGKLMPVLMERFKGRAEGRTLSQVAREVLSQ
jgi:hypothetical protein